MKKFLLTLLLLFPTVIFGLKTGTVCFLPLASDASDQGGSYTWTNTGVTFETKDGYPAGKFLNADTTDNIVTTGAVTETILTIVFDIWITSPNGTTADWRLHSANAPNQSSLQYYNNNIYIYDGADGHGQALTWTNIPTDQWVNIAQVFDTTAGYVKFYVNNVLKTESLVCHGGAANLYRMIGNAGWGANQSADIWVRNFRLMTTIESSFPIVDDTPTITPTHTPSATPTVTPTITATPTYTVTMIIQKWEKLNESAAFPPRGFAGSTQFKNKMWIAAGSTLDSIAGTQYNDVWYSINGYDWKPATQNAAFSSRRRATLYSYDNKLWILGGIGNGGDYKRDVWYSTNGADWTLATGNAAWGDPNIITGGSNGRIQMAYKGIVFDNKMWVISGQVQDVGCLPDVWWSTNGADWYATTRLAQFNGRSGGALATFDNKMWVIGGAACSGPAVNNSYYSSDGITWTSAGDLPYGHLQHHSAISFNGALWVLFGAAGNPGPNQNEAIWTTDGATWHVDTTGLYARGAGCAEAYVSNMYVFSGYENEDTVPTSVNSVYKSTISTHISDNYTTDSLTTNSGLNTASGLNP